MSELLCISEIDDDVIFIGKYIRIKNEPILIEDDLYEPKLTPELMKADTESEKEKAYKNCIIAAEILKNKKTFVNLPLCGFKCCDLPCMERVLR